MTPVDEPEAWPFDQGPLVAAITTRQVLREHHPILQVRHYADDHSWAFTCGTTDDVRDGLVISMQEALKLDPTIASIAHLPPGWSAWRPAAGGAWNEYRNEDG
jgi:hypothetical protein